MPQPIHALLARLNDEQAEFRRHQQRSKPHTSRQRPRSAAVLSKTPLASAWPQHQPRPRSAAAAARAQSKRRAARGDMPGGRISASELRAGAREQREERPRLLQHAEVGCVSCHLRAQRSFSSTAAPPRFDCPHAEHGRRAQAVSRVAELLCADEETRAVLRLQRCWRRRQRVRQARQQRRVASVTRAIHLKITEAKLELSQLFRQLDADNSGGVSYGELRTGLTRLGVPALTDEEFSLLVRLLDQVRPYPRCRCSVAYDASVLIALSLDSLCDGMQTRMETARLTGRSSWCSLSTVFSRPATLSERWPRVARSVVSVLSMVCRRASMSTRARSC